MKLTLIIPSRGEPLWEYTVRSALESATYSGDIEILPIEDSKGEGVDIIRDRGIMAAQADLVAVADAHLTFSPDWDARILDQFTDPTAVACVCCERLSSEDMLLSAGHARHFGAYAVETGGGVPNWGLTAQWIKYPDEHPTGTIEVPVPLGGFYVLSKTHYIETLARPWQHLRSYGKSEELISVLQWKLGYPTICLTDITIGHCFRKYPPYTQQTAMLRQNKLLLAHVAADTDKELSRLLNCMGLSNVRIERELAPIAGVIESYRERFKREQKRPYAAWMDWNRTYEGGQTGCRGTGSVNGFGHASACRPKSSLR